MHSFLLRGKGSRHRHERWSESANSGQRPQQLRPGPVPCLLPYISWPGGQGAARGVCQVLRTVKFRLRIKVHWVTGAVGASRGERNP